MRIALSLVLGVATLLSPGLLIPARAGEEPEAARPPIPVAEAAAKSWLSLVDSHKYGESWDEAAAFFKEKVTKAQWEQMLGTVRSPLGKVNSRNLASARNVKELPNAPKGDYVVIQYSTSFASLPSAIETVVPMLGKDGHWRVSGYFIKKN
jgi:hypothetical protein